MKSLLFTSCLLFILTGLGWSQSNNTITITDDDLKNGSYNWSNDFIYLLDGKVYLESGGRLTIEAGTIIKAKEVPSNGDPTTLLNIQRGAVIIAEGTEENPIIFTTETDNLNGNLTQYDESKWGGIVMVGMNGFNSGHLAYVSIRYAGQRFEGIENAALTFWQVDKSTTLQFIEVFKSNSDGITFIGGDAILTNATVSFTEDDAFNWDYGWTGAGIYWFSFLGTLSIEGKGNSYSNEPLYSNPQIFNGTFLNATGTSNFEAAEGISFEANSAGTISNSVFQGFDKYGLNVEKLGQGNSSQEQLVAGNLNIKNNIWLKERKYINNQFVGVRKINLVPNDTLNSFLIDHLIQNNNITGGSGIRIFGCNRNPTFDPRLAENEYLELPNANYPDKLQNFKPSNNQKGAFPDGVLWTKNWTALDLLGEIGDEAIVKYKFQDKFYKTGDTIIISCEEMAIFNDNICVIDPCNITSFPTGIASRSSRRGNRRRPAGRKIFGRTLLTNQVAFIEDWIMDGGVFESLFSYLQPEVEFTLMIIDTIPPIIHPISDKEGQLTAILEDCDEAWFTKIEKDTQFLSFSYVVTTTFYAEDFSGNRSSLQIEQLFSDLVETYYPDLDNDGFGNPDLPILLSEPLSGFVLNDLDCNDDNPNINPNNTDFYGDDCTSPINDICKTAFELKIGEINNPFNHQLSSSSIYPVPSTYCFSLKNYRGLWFKTIVPQSGQIITQVYVPRDELGSFIFEGFTVEVYKGNCDSLLFLDCFSGDDFSFHLDNLEPNSELFYRLIENGNINWTTFDIIVKDPNEFSLNDNCPGAIEIKSNQFCDFIPFDVDIANYSSSGSFSSNCISISGVSMEDAWFSFTPTSINDYLVSIENLEFNGNFYTAQVFRGDCSEKNEIGCDTQIDGLEITIPNSNLGEKLWIRVSDTYRNLGKIQIKICEKQRLIPIKTEKDGASNLTIFPNPTAANQQLTIESEDVVKGETAISLVDLQGRIVKKTVTKKNYRTIFNANDITPGMYLLKLHTPTRVISKKIVITH